MPDGSETVERLQKEIAAIARSMIAGEISFLRGARKIATMPHGHQSRLRSDPDILPFISIDSETDELPLEDSIRELWSSDALQKLEPKIQSAERWARDSAMKNCQNLVARFG